MSKFSFKYLGISILIFLALLKLYWFWWDYANTPRVGYDNVGGNGPVITKHEKE